MDSLGREPQVEDIQMNRAPEGRQIRYRGVCRSPVARTSVAAPRLVNFLGAKDPGLTPRAKYLPPLRGS